MPDEPNTFGQPALEAGGLTHDAAVHARRVTLALEPTRGIEGLSDDVRSRIDAALFHVRQVLIVLDMMAGAPAAEPEGPGLAKRGESP